MDEFKKKFNHDYGVSKKIRLILEYLNNSNQKLESKINEHIANKDIYEKKISELEVIIKDKDILLESNNKAKEDYKKTIDEHIFKYGQLNSEFIKINDISKEIKETNNNENNTNEIKKSFSELLLVLKKYKEILLLKCAPCWKN